METLEIELKLTVAHINTILKHLGAGAYAEVSEIVNLLHGQARPQIEQASQPAPAQPEPEQTVQ